MPGRRAYTFEVFTKTTKPGNLIGWRKTSKRACEFAEDLLTRFNHSQVVVKKRDRKPEDFSY